MFEHLSPEALRDLASRSIHDQIRRDQERTSELISPWLDHIWTHLFDPGLNVTQLRRVLGIRNNSEAIFFHIEIGIPPGRYIEQHRLRIARLLLLYTRVPITPLAPLVGYRGIASFSRAFHRLHGLRPRAYRNRHTTPVANSASDGRGWHHSLPRLVQRLQQLDLQTALTFGEHFEIDVARPATELAAELEGRVREAHRVLDDIEQTRL
ncbi:MAG: helix-turn-helix domain-containing protein [Acidobacteriota bacterium]